LDLQLVGPKEKLNVTFATTDAGQSYETFYGCKLQLVTGKPIHPGLMFAGKAKCSSLL